MFFFAGKITFNFTKFRNLQKDNLELCLPHIPEKLIPHRKVYNKKITLYKRRVKGCSVLKLEKTAQFQINQINSLYNSLEQPDCYIVFCNKGLQKLYFGIPKEIYYTYE